MMTPEQRKQYDAIRPFEPDELPEVYDRLLKDPQVQQVLSRRARGDAEPENACLQDQPRLSEDVLLRLPEEAFSKGKLRNVFPS